MLYYDAVELKEKLEKDTRPDGTRAFVKVEIVDRGKDQHPITRHSVHAWKPENAECQIADDCYL